MSAPIYNGEQPSFMSDETFAHYNIVQRYPLYWETRNWHPVLVKENQPLAMNWLLQKKLVRGTIEARNDWLHPTRDLFIFRNIDAAIEFKLRWS